MRNFSPDLLLVSAGFDPYERDPVGGFRVTVDGFKRIAARWRELSEQLTGGRIAGVLEGGYDIEGLGACGARRARGVERVRRMLQLFLAGFLGSIGCQVPSHPSSSARQMVPLPRVVTGANIRAVGDDRRGYGTRAARQTMERLQKLGVNTIAVLVEGWMSSRGDTNIAPPSKTELEAIRATLVDANALGLATIIIPHLYLADGDWRGYIVLEDPAQREAWWASYEAFIEVAADLASSSSATMLSIGVELKGLSREADTHARMIALGSRVRREYRGLLTYSANWDEAEDVGFWDAVDVAGVNGYYPLVPDPERGAEAIARRLTLLSERAQHEVIVLETGYRSSRSRT